MDSKQVRGWVEQTCAEQGVPGDVHHENRITNYE